MIVTKQSTIQEFLYPEPVIINPNKITEIDKSNIKQKSCLIADNGVFFGLAQRLSRDFGEVYYYTDWAEEFPTIDQVMIGAGFDNIIPIKDFFSVTPDLYIFPNSNNAHLQNILIKSGCKVFGSRFGDQLEQNRWFGLTETKKDGLPVPQVYKLVGCDNLIKFLKDKTDKWIKISYYRGEGETWHYTNYTECEDYLNKLKNDLGAVNKVFEFLVFDPINAEIETGFDGIFIDDAFLNIVSMGYEIKDCAYVAKYLNYNDLPPIVKVVGDKITPSLSQFGYRNMFSTEERIPSNGTPFFTDWTCRFGSPSNELFIENITNLGEAIWNGAQGIKTILKCEYAYGVQAHIYSEYACHNWTNISYPKEIERFVTLRNCCKIEDKIYIIPQPYEYPEIGTVLGFGNTLQEAIDMCKINAEQIKGFQVEIKLDSIEKGIEQIQKGEKYGITF